MTPAQKAARRAARKAERDASNDRIARSRAEVQAIVASGKCPTCGSRVRRNSSLTGWWQCEQYGAEGFRARASEPSCSWQGFTD